MEQPLLQSFIKFGLAGLIGFALGLERAMAGSENPHAGTRDFIMFALLGAVSAYIGEMLGNYWIIVTGFLGSLALLLLGYWIDRDRDSGITTEVAAILTFFLGVLIMIDAEKLAIALAIIILAILSQKKVIHKISAKIQLFELQATIKFLIITFIILPVLPEQPLSSFLAVPFGNIQSYAKPDSELNLQVAGTFEVSAGESYKLLQSGHEIGMFTVETSREDLAEGKLSKIKNDQNLVAGTQVDRALDIGWLNTMLGALNPYKIWLIVVLVSMISLVGYVAVKLLGPGAGNELTGLIGGLASSTVTTVAFAKRSKESPAFNSNFAVAILLASSIMFPRLLLEIAIVNQELMKNMALPIIVMGSTGMILALVFALKTKKKEPTRGPAMQLENPFCLKSAITFGVVFSIILMLTRLATSYMGENWLPLVAVVSGLVDADAIAFSLSDAQKAGIITLDWASFNLVLGALSNTMVKLFFVFSLGHRQLFRQLMLSFTIVSAVGIITTFFYYDL
jgi:uncharacterized membrane protein (DUF4010 family)